MSVFQVRHNENGISAIIDKRYDETIDITDGTGRFGNLVYTLLSEDITTADKPEFVPYNEHFAAYDALCQKGDCVVLNNEEFETTLCVSEYSEHLLLEMECRSDKVSACGMFLPLNFLSCKNGNSSSQFLISSPYHTRDKECFLHFFTRPDGKHLLLVAEGGLDGYKINYSPFLCGHYIRGFSFLWQLDRAYGLPERKERKLRLHVIAVNSYEEALKRASEIWKKPAIYYDIASTKMGSVFTFRGIGKIDCVKVVSPSGRETEIAEMSFVPNEYGIYTLVPYQDGKPGMDVSVFAWDDKKEMFQRAMDSLTTYHKDILGETKEGISVWRPTHLFYRNYFDHNLCEHGMWCWALLRYMRVYGPVKAYEKEVKNLLNIVLADESGVSLNACSILKEQGYRTKNSTRIQEVYAGVNILLDAYKVFGDHKYLEYAVTILHARLAQDLSREGAIMRHGSDGETAENADYTTVTGMIFPVVDLAVCLKQMGDERYKYFEKAAIRIADFVVRRGFSFPTEGGQHPEVNVEIEEGSISCSALTVLYVAMHIQNKQEYLDYAKEILELHDAYTVYTPHPVMFRSSLRWWETIWEGNSDGPAVCFGHAWSLWRAEAQFLYGILCQDNRRLLDSYNGFMGNYAKEDRKGYLYAIYQYEPISSGELKTNGREMDYRVCDGFPDRPDDTISRYVFARDFQCWQRCAAVVEVDGKMYYLGCHAENESLIFDGISLEKIYLGTAGGTYKFQTNDKPEIICSANYTVKRASHYLMVSVEEGVKR